MPPLVSVILIVHNGESTLELAIASLVAQTFQDWESIIIDDASTDATGTIIASITDPRFIVTRPQRQLGRGAARQMALSLSSGAYITTLDADDFLFPRKIELQVKILEADPELTATAAGLFYVDEELNPLGIPVGYFPSGTRRIPSRPSHLRLPFVGTMFRRDRVGHLTFSDQQRGEDMQFYTRLLSGQKIYVEPTFTYGYRWAMKIQDVILGLKESLKFYSALTDSAPLSARRLVIYTIIKIKIYQTVWQLGLWPLSLQLRYRKAPKNVVNDLRATLERLQKTGTTQTIKSHT